MNIQRIQTGSVTANAAGQVQRGAREQEKVQVGRPTPTRADKADTEKRSTEAARTEPRTTEPRGVSPRLAAYADRIEGRLSHILADRSLSPRQRAALEEAQAHFHEMIQQLDTTYENGTNGRETIGDALKGLVAQLASTVNHIQSGGTPATTFAGQIDVKG
jgi:hypothetical protein